MQSVQEFRKNFNNIFFKKIFNMIAPYEQERKRCFVFYSVCLAVLVGSIVLTYISLMNLNNLPDGMDSDIAFYMCFLPAVIGILLFCVAYSAAKGFELKIKRIIMPILLRGIEGFIWTERQTVDDALIRDSELIGNYNAVKVDDNFTGEYKNVGVSISEIELGEWRHSYVGRKNKTYERKFKGVIVVLYPEKEYKCKILIKKDGLVDFVPGGLEKVNLEDPEFERKYNVYSNDQIESRYVLTTAFLNRFNNINLAFDASKIEASIKDSRIVIALSTTKDMFKVGSLHKAVCDYRQFKQLAEEFASILELIDELKLNQNIGL